MKKPKRVLFVSDFHCGHRAGLTPPDWQTKYHSGSKTQKNKFARLQAELWEFYAETITALQPIDIAVLNGDLIDGRGEKSGSTELIAVDRNEQCDMAIEAVEHIGADEIIMTFGTGYHTGSSEDFETTIAAGVAAKKIGSHEWIDVNGTVFDVKHHIGSSGIPHGRFSALAKDKLWSQLWELGEDQPKSDILIRSHVHYHVYCGGPSWLAMTLPALQGYGSKYGARLCSGRVDIGMVWFDVEPDGGYAWSAELAKLDSQRAIALKL